MINFVNAITKVQEILANMVTNNKSGNPEKHITPAHPSPLIM